MRAEELYESLLVATEAHKTRGSYEEQEKPKADWLQQFTIAFGTDEGDEATTFNGTIPQALMMMNGDLIKKATSIDKGSFLHTVASQQLEAGREDRLPVPWPRLARKPEHSEIDVANKLLRRSRGRHGRRPARHLVGRAEQQRVHPAITRSRAAGLPAWRCISDTAVSCTQPDALNHSALLRRLRHVRFTSRRHVPPPLHDAHGRRFGHGASPPCRLATACGRMPPT